MLLRAAPRITLVAFSFVFATHWAQAVTVRNVTTGELLFFDDFESAPNGVSSVAAPDNSGDYDPVAQVGAWSIIPDAEPVQTNVQVTNTTLLPDIASGASQGDNYLRLYRSGNPTHRAHATFAPQATVGDVIRMETMVAISSFTDTSFSSWTAWDSAGSPVISGGFTFYGETTHASRYGGATGTTFFSTLDFTPGEWFRFALEYQIGAATFSIEVDDATVDNVVLRYDAYPDANNPMPPMNITSFAFGASDEGTGAPRRLYLDAVPEVDLPGDYNGDGTVNLADYVVWRDAFGSTTAMLPNDATPDSVTDEDYSIWRANFGSSSMVAEGFSTGGSPVPEPDIACFALLIGIVGRVVWRRGPSHADKTA